VWAVKVELLPGASGTLVGDLQTDAGRHGEVVTVPSLPRRQDQGLPSRSLS